MNQAQQMNEALGVQVDETKEKEAMDLWVLPGLKQAIKKDGGKVKRSGKGSVLKITIPESRSGGAFSGEFRFEVVIRNAQED